jgi:hypothetical protein
MKNINPSEFQFPMSRAMAVASLACFVSLIFIHWVARPAVEMLGVWWVELLVYGSIPIFATFIILYRSNWHREVTGVPRTCSLLLLSCVILGVLLFLLGVSVLAVSLFSSALQARGGGTR